MARKQAPEPELPQEQGLSSGVTRLRDRDGAIFEEGDPATVQVLLKEHGFTKE